MKPKSGHYWFRRLHWTLAHQLDRLRQGNDNDISESVRQLTEGKPRRSLRHRTKRDTPIHLQEGELLSLASDPSG